MVLFWPVDDAAGITMDWTYDPTDGANVKYSYTPELRGPGGISNIFLFF